MADQQPRSSADHVARALTAYRRGLITKDDGVRVFSEAFGELLDSLEPATETDTDIPTDKTRGVHEDKA